MAKTPSEKTINAALETLDNVISIAKREMMVQGTYISDGVVDEKLARKGAICGGHQACFVGSLYLGAKIPIKKMLDPQFGFEWSSRRDIMKNRPALRMAYEAANDAAFQWAFTDNHKNERGVNPDFYSAENDPDYCINNWAEDLFEEGFIGEGWDNDRIMHGVIEVCRLAKRNIKKQYKQVLEQSPELVAA